jgi:cysteine desulfuration protein SufE
MGQSGGSAGGTVGRGFESDCHPPALKWHNQDVTTKLNHLAENLSLLEPDERVQLLIDFADHFEEVPSRIAVRPFPRENLIPHCESEAYVWLEGLPDNRVKLYFAVENPSGVSAKALAVILDKTLSGLTAEEVASVSPEIVQRLFRRDISMGKGMGLMAMVQAVQVLARRLSRARS